MTAIPAQVAGVERIVVCLAEAGAGDAGGGASAGHRRSSIAWAERRRLPRWPTGRRSLPRVDKIVGPGNLFVTAAKRLVAFDCGIDMLAGPDGDCGDAARRGHAEEIAADLVAQAEHDPEALAMLDYHADGTGQAGDREVKQQSRQNRVAREVACSARVAIL